MDIVVDTSRLLVDRNQDPSGNPNTNPAGGPNPENVYILDPSQSTVVAAGISTIDGDEYYDGDERRILSILDQRFAVLDPGIISTWNGSIFDLPFLRARARALRLGLGLRVRPDRRRHLRRVADQRQAPSLRVGDQNGSSRPVCGAWHRQRHLDLRWVYGDASDTDSLTDMDPRRGAHLARSLAERRWVRARRHLDRIPPQTNQLASYTWTCIAPDAEDGPTVRIPASAKARHPSSGSALRR
ncbi:MAG: hypothetical protein AAF531_04870 [Actinomycetota bacterium]